MHKQQSETVVLLRDMHATPLSADVVALFDFFVSVVIGSDS